MSQTKEVHVADTSSILDLREHVTVRERRTVLQHFNAMATKDELYVPPQVLEELTRAKRPCPFADWARNLDAKATRYGSCFPQMAQMLQQHPILQKVLDPDKSTNQEEADLFVLATACLLRDSGLKPIVLTEESRDSRVKLSLGSACGIIRVVRLNMKTYLLQNGLWAYPAP